MTTVLLEQQKPVENRWKTYSAYKDSGVELLGEVPEHWEVRRLKHMSTRSAVYGCNETASNYIDNGVRFLRTSDITDFGELLNENPVFLETTAVRDYVLDDGDLLISRSGTIGRSFLYQSEIHGQPFAYAGYLVRFSLRDFMHPPFTFYFTKAAAFVAWLGVSVIQSTIGNVNGQKYANMAVPMPPKKEQQTIASFLDRETSRIDELVIKKERQMELLNEKRQALITHAVTKGLDPNVKMKDSGIEWLGEVPEHWEVSKTKFVAKMKSGHTPSRQHPEYWVDCSVPWFTLADVWQIRDDEITSVSQTKEMISELGLHNSSAELLPEGTVIVSRTASVGYSAILQRPMATTQDFVNWICGSSIFPEYLLYVFRSMRSEFSRLTMGSTHMTIYMPDAASFQTPVPPIEEQGRIAAMVSESEQKLMQCSSLIEASIDKLKEYRSALISAAVTGKIDVRNEAS